MLTWRLPPRQLFTAVAYAELVTKYPRGAGAALYVNNAFGVALITFIGRVRGDLAALRGSGR